MCVIGNFNVYVNNTHTHTHTHIYIYICVCVCVCVCVIDRPAGKFHIKISNIVDCTCIDELDLRAFVA